MTYKQMFDSAYPTPHNLADINKAKEIWVKYWPCLKFESNLQAPVLALEDKVNAWVSSKPKIVGPRKATNIVFEDSGKVVKKITNGDLEQNFYGLMETHKEKFQFLAFYLPTVIESKNNFIRFKSFLIDEDMENASLMKVDLLRQDSDFNFSIREAIHKLSDTGKVDCYQNWDDRDIWHENPDKDRVNAIMTDFCSNYGNLPLKDYSPIIDGLTKVLWDIQMSLEELLSENPQFAAKDFHLQSLSLVLILNHKKGLYNVKMVSPKVSKDKSKGRLPEIQGCLKSFITYVEGFNDYLVKDLESREGAQEDFMAMFRNMMKEKKEKSESDTKDD